MAESSPLIYACINCALIGVVVIPIFVIWMISLCGAARRRGDPARAGVTWMNVLFPMLFVSFFFNVISEALFAVLVSSALYGTDSYFSIDNAEVRIGLFATWLERLADLLFLIVMVELSLGFLYTLEHRRSSAHNGLRYTTFGVCVVLFAIGTAFYGMDNSAWTPYFANADSADNTTEAAVYNNLDKQLYIGAQLITAFEILYFIISIGLIILTSLVLKRFPSGHPMRKSVIMLVVCAVLTTVRFIWLVAYDAAFLLPHNSAPFYTAIIDPIFDAWPFFIILVLLFVVARRKDAGGLWTTAQPWMGGGAPQPSGSPAYGNGVGAVSYVNGNANPGAYPQGVPAFVPAQPQQVYYMPQQHQQQFQQHHQPMAGGGYAYPPGQQIVGWQLQPVNQPAAAPQAAPQELEHRHLVHEAGSSEVSESKP